MKTLLLILVIICFASFNCGKGDKDAKVADAKDKKVEQKDQSKDQASKPKEEKPKEEPAPKKDAIAENPKVKELVSLDDQIMANAGKSLTGLIKNSMADCTKFEAEFDKFVKESEPKTMDILNKQKEIFKSLSQQEKDQTKSFMEKSYEQKYKEDTEIMKKFAEIAEKNPQCKKGLEKFMNKMQNEWDFTK